MGNEQQIMCKCNSCVGKGVYPNVSLNYDSNKILVGVPCLSCNGSRIINVSIDKFNSGRYEYYDDTC